MASLLTNQTATVALQTLRSVNADLEEVQQRISTGLSVRTAGDNAAFFLVAQTVRGDVAVVEAVRDNLTLSINAATTANDGIQRIFGQLNDLQGAAALAGSGQALEELDFALEQTVTIIEDFIEGTSFNGTNLLLGSGTFTATTAVTRVNGNFTLQTQTISELNLGSQDLAGVASNLFTAQTSAVATATAPQFQEFTVEERAQANFDALFRAFNPSLADRLDGNGDGVVNLLNADVANGVVSDDDIFAADAADANDGQFSFAGSLDDVFFLASIGIESTFNEGQGPDGEDVVTIDITNGGLVGGAGVDNGRQAASTFLETVAAGSTEFEQRLLTTGIFDGTAITNTTPLATFSFGTGATNAIDLSTGTPASTFSFEGTAAEAEALQAAGFESAVFAGGRVTVDFFENAIIPQNNDFSNGTTGAFGSVEDLLQGVVFVDTALREFADNSGFTTTLRQLDLARGTGRFEAVLTLTDSLISRTNLAAAQVSNLQSVLEDRQSFLDDLVGSLNTGIASLVEADLDEESTRLQALQVQEQLAIQALTIANARPQNLLALFQ